MIIGVLALFIAGAGFYLMPERTLSDFEQKKKNAKTLLMYELSPNASVEISVLPSDDTFYVLSHVVVPRQLRYDPHKEWVYALRATFIDASGQERHTQTYFEQTRQSKDRLTEHGYLLENAFLPSADEEVTDERLTVLSSGRVLPSGGRIRVTLTHAKSPALLRIYRIQERTDLQRLKRYHLMAEHRKERIATYMGLGSLENLAMDELVDVFARRWQRVEAVLPHGGDPKTRRMYHTGFRLPGEVTDESLVHLDPGRGVTFNLRGPLTLELEGHHDENNKASSSPFVVTARTLCACPSECADLEERKITLVPADTTARLDLGPGDQTLVISNPSTIISRKIKVLCNDCLERLIGYARAVESGTEPQSKPALLPEEVGLEAAIFEPDRAPGVSFSALGSDGSRLLRLDVRAILGSPVDTTPRSFEVSFLDEKGRTVAKESREHLVTPSLFERWTGSDDERAPRLWFSDSSSVYLVPTASTRRIAVSSSHPLALRAFVHHLPIAARQLPYPEPCEGRGWRFRQGLEDEWMQLDPEHWKELREDNRLAAILAMTRLERDPEPSTDGLPGYWRAVPPVQEGAEELVYSETSVDLAQMTAGELPDNLRVSCPPDTPVDIPLPPDADDSGRGILEFLYYIPPGVDIDGTIEVRRKDTLIAAVEPLTRKNTYRSRRLARLGALTWSHDFEPEPPMLFFAAQPRSRAELAALSVCRLFKAFYVTPIPPGESRRFIAQRPKELDTYVNFEVYSADPEKLTLIIDGGRPNRGPMKASRGFTRGLYEHVLEVDEGKAVWMPARAQFPLRGALTVSAPLHGDLTVGAHTIEARNDGPATIWVRSFQRMDTPSRKDKIRVKVRSL